MPARFEDSWGTALPLAQANGQRLSNGRGGVPGNNARRGLGRTDEKSPALRVAADQEISLMKRAPERLPIMKLLIVRGLASGASA